MPPQPKTQNQPKTTGKKVHSDRRQLVDYARRIQPKPEPILTCHGEASKCINLTSHLHRDIGQRRHLETRAIQNFETLRLY